MSTSSAVTARPDHRPATAQPAWGRLVALVSFPVRATVAFGHASIGAAQLMQADGPVRLLHQLSSVTASDRPLGQALQRGGVVDRVLDENGVFARLSQPGGVLDRILAPAGLIDRILARGGTVDRLLSEGGTVDRLIAPGGPLDRIVAVDGPLDRLLEQEGAIDRMLEPGGVVDRLLAREGVLEQLVAENGVLDRLGRLMENVEDLGPVLASLERVVDEIDRSVKGLDGNLDELSTAIAPLSEIAGRMPGARKRIAARQAAAEPSPPQT